jgi:hypothetical protein
VDVEVPGTPSTVMIENDKDMHGPFDSVSGLMDALNA